MAKPIMLTTEERSIGSYELTVPIVDGGQKLDVLFFRRVNAGDLSAIERAARIGVCEADIVIIARLAGLTQDTAERIAAEDIKGIKKAMEDFLSEAVREAMDEAKQNALALSAISSASNSLLTGESG